MLPPRGRIAQHARQTTSSGNWALERLTPNSSQTESIIGNAIAYAAIGLVSILVSARAISKTPK